MGTVSQTVFLASVLGLILKAHGLHYYNRVDLSSPPNVQTQITKPKLNISLTNCQIQCSIQFDTDKSCTATMETEEGNCTLLLLTKDSLKPTDAKNHSLEVRVRPEIFQGEAVFIVGGSNGIMALDLADVFTLNDKCKKSLKTLPIKVYAPVFRLLQNSPLICGGVVSSYVINKDCWKYNYQKDQWVWVTRSNYTHYGFAGEVYQNKLYLVDPTNAELYDPVIDQWLTWKPIPNSIGSGRHSIIWRDVMLVAGGYNFGSLFLKFNFTSYSWEEKQISPLTLQDAILQILPYNPNLMLACSFDNVVIYDLSTDLWTKAGRPNTVRYGANMVSIQGRIFIMGAAWGYDSLDSIEEFHHGNLSWTMTSLKLPSKNQYYNLLKIPAFFIDCDGNL